MILAQSHQQLLNGNDLVCSSQYAVGSQWLQRVKKNNICDQLVSKSIERYATYIHLKITHEEIFS